jgi:hypothetical protein
VATSCTPPEIDNAFVVVDVVPKLRVPQVVFNKENTSILIFISQSPKRVTHV